MRKRGSAPPPLHELEREVMEEVWEAGEASVRDVLEAINARADRQRAYTTVMTTMQRLERKGILEHRPDGRSHRYRAVLDREEYRVQRAGAEVDALVDELGDAALVAFSRRMDALDPARRNQLRRLARRD